MNIYVGNISRESSENEVKQVFEEYGEVTSCKLIKDKFTGVSKGFGFVEMPNKEQADNAIKNLDGKKIEGRAMSVAEAKPRTENRKTGGYNKYGNNNNMNKRRY
ncbi:MAG: RNA-binding protein [Ignavibacteriae bacterium]|nr:MAG: RNA-binding protein [Ignavibacteriota bacterium]